MDSACPFCFLRSTCKVIVKIFSLSIQNHGSRVSSEIIVTLPFLNLDSAFLDCD
ncbi:hypothetical protein Mapa_006657 [Marchantia paleacea]|nr:hypothetical protein Mapa_006657 [Marchantia paleacea]